MRPDKAHKEYINRWEAAAPLFDEFIEKHDDNKAQEWNPSLASEIDYVIPFPCEAQDLQKWIMETSHKIQPGLAFASAIVTLSTIFGRSMQVDGIKGNLMVLGLAESGEGKDWPLKACLKVLDSIDMAGHFYSEMASGAALFDAVSETPNSLMAIDEVGHYFASINSKASNQFSKELMPMITGFYTSSADVVIEKKRKGQESRRICEPNLSFFGLSTERQIMDSLRTSEVADGSLARFMVIFGENNVDINRNRKSNAVVPDHIKNRLELKKSSPFFIKSTQIILSDDYAKAKLSLEDEFNKKAIELGKCQGDKAMFKPFFHRMAVRSVQLALIIDSCYSIDVLHWCADLVEKSANVFIKKFCHLSADNETERFVKIVERAIKESGKNGITKQKFYDKTRSVDPRLKQMILAQLIDSDKIFVNEDRGINSKKPTTVYFWRK